MARSSTYSLEIVAQAQSTSYRFACSTCPYVHNITKRISNRLMDKQKYLWLLNVYKKDVVQNPMLSNMLCFVGATQSSINNMLCRSYTKLKEVDDVLGGAAAWENVDSCDEKVNIYMFVKQLGSDSLIVEMICIDKIFLISVPKV